jgi:FtsZ-binding cell division protein ZapB
MDTSSILLGGILTLLCLSPFLMEIIRLRNRNKTIQHITKNLNGTEKAQFKNLTQLKSIILGWDPKLGKLLFYRKNGNNPPLWLDLKTFQEVHLELKRFGSSKNDPIAEITIELKGKDHQERLCLFQSTSDSTLGGEYQLGKEWQERLQHHFKAI